MPQRGDRNKIVHWRGPPYAAALCAVTASAGLAPSKRASRFPCHWLQRRRRGDRSSTSAETRPVGSREAYDPAGPIC